MNRVPNPGKDHFSTGNSLPAEAHPCDSVQQEGDAKTTICNFSGGKRGLTAAHSVAQGNCCTNVLLLQAQIHLTNGQLHVRPDKNVVAWVKWEAHPASRCQTWSITVIRTIPDSHQGPSSSMARARLDEPSSQPPTPGTCWMLSLPYPAPEAVLIMSILVSQAYSAYKQIFDK